MGSRLMQWMLNLAYLVGLVLMLPWFVIQMFRSGKYQRESVQRFGAGLKAAAAKLNSRPIWIHAVSVGELRLCEPLVKALKQRFPDVPLVITHTTRTGEEVAAQLYPDDVRLYSPVDLSWVVRRYFKLLKPRMLLLVELELWPNWLMIARDMGVPTLLANGRISERSARGYGRIAGLLRPAFDAIEQSLVQNEEYAERLRSLYGKMGLEVDRVRVAGNIKYEGAARDIDASLRASYRQLVGCCEHDLLVVAGSTHSGEHEHLPRLYKAWRAAGLPIRLVVVPRHPERWDAVRAAFKEASVPLANRSQQQSPVAQPEGDVLPSVLLLDTMGELGKLYHAADIAFIGGSLIPHGGQNMIEAAGLGLPVIFGPHTKNFSATVRDLKHAKACVVVQEIDELQREVGRLAQDGVERARLGREARRVIEAGTGALTAHMQVIENTMARIGREKVSREDA